MKTSCTLFYTAFSDSIPLNAQLHRVGLDGKNQRRLTEEHFNHSVTLSNDFKWFTTEYSVGRRSADHCALTTRQAIELRHCARSDDSKFKSLGLPPELLETKADDGVTTCMACCYKPSHFNPCQEVSVGDGVSAGGALANGAGRFGGASAACEYGFLIASIDNRGTQNRGKALEDRGVHEARRLDVKDQPTA